MIDVFFPAGTATYLTRCIYRASNNVDDPECLERISADLSNFETNFKPVQEFVIENGFGPDKEFRSQVIKKLAGARHTGAAVVSMLEEIKNFDADNEFGILREKLEQVRRQRECPDPLDTKVSNTQDDVAAMKKEERVDAADAKDRAECLAWLSSRAATDYMQKHRRIMQSRASNTSNQLLTFQRFDKWKTWTSTLVFGTGAPGVGKTVMSAVLIETLYQEVQHQPKLGLAFMYHEYPSSDDRRSPDDTLTAGLFSLIQQLVSNKPSIPEEVIQFWRNFKDCSPREPTAFQLRQLLRQICDLHDHVYIILDGLDHTPTTSQNFWIKHILSILKQSRYVHVLITSHPSDTINNILEATGQAGSRISYSCEKQLTASEEDMRAYFRTQSRLLSSLVRRYPYVQFDNNMRDILKESGGSFGTAVRLIRKLTLVILDQIAGDLVEDPEKHEKMVLEKLRLYSGEDRLEKALQQLRLDSEDDSTSEESSEETVKDLLMQLTNLSRTDFAQMCPDFAQEDAVEEPETLTRAASETSRRLPDFAQLFGVQSPETLTRATPVTTTSLSLLEFTRLFGAEEPATSRSLPELAQLYGREEPEVLAQSSSLINSCDWPAHDDVLDYCMVLYFRLKEAQQSIHKPLRVQELFEEPMHCDPKTELSEKGSMETALVWFDILNHGATRWRQDDARAQRLLEKARECQQSYEKHRKSYQSTFAERRARVSKYSLPISRTLARPPGSMSHRQALSYLMATAARWLAHYGEILRAEEKGIASRSEEEDSLYQISDNEALAYPALSMADREEYLAVLSLWLAHLPPKRLSRTKALLEDTTKVEIKEDSARPMDVRFRTNAICEIYWSYHRLHLDLDIGESWYGLW